MQSIQTMCRARYSGATATRPNDTTQYAAGDAVGSTPGDVLTFGVPTGASLLQGLVLIDSAAQATKPDLELWLFDTTVAVDDDNAAFTPTDAEMATLIGIVAIPVASFKAGDATAGAGGNAACDVTLTTPLPIVTKPGKNEIYGVLVARNTYTPVANESFAVRLRIVE